MKSILRIPYLLVLLSLALLACESAPPSQEVKAPSEVMVAADSVAVVQPGPPPTPPETEIIVRRKADYPDQFIEGLKGLGYQRIELRDSFLIVDGKETHSFPVTPKKGGELTFTGVLDKMMMALHVKRITMTTVNYRIEMVEWGKASHNLEGEATLAPDFFQRKETDVHDPSGKHYDVVRFTDNREGDCHVEIRIGTEPMGQPYLLARLRKNCNGKLPDLTSENAPLLHEK